LRQPFTTGMAGPGFTENPWSETRGVEEEPAQAGRGLTGFHFWTIYSSD
jgi:hypothetical protein